MPRANLPVVGQAVLDLHGQLAKVVAINPEAADQAILLRLDDGRLVSLEAGLLQLQADGSWQLPLVFEQLASPSETVIPLMEEQVTVGKKMVDTGRGVRLRKIVSERAETIDPPLLHEELVIDHVDLNQMQAAGVTPVVHYDGDTLVIPVLEEVLVVEKRLLLKEEVRILRKVSQVHAAQTVILRSEQILAETFTDLPAKPSLNSEAADSGTHGG
ncbi:MAG: YsnF/AvaK domain-containing protein [Pseudomonadota bacterium]